MVSQGPLADFKGLNTNARAETVGTVASFKGPYARRRCLVPATHYFEWTENPDNPKGRKFMWKFIVPLSRCSRSLAYGSAPRRPTGRLRASPC